jgi:hypothetical protein
MAAPTRWLLLLVLSGCSSPTRTREPDEYTGCAKDENWITFDDQEPNVKVDDTQAPQVTAPSPGPYTDKQIFRWNQDANDVGAPEGDVIHDGIGCNHCCDQWNIGALTTLHLAAISGNVYDLKISTGGSVVHRVISTLQEWTPHDDVWQSWRGKQLSMTLTRMNVLKDDPKQGPYRGSQPFVFSVK